MLDRFPNIDRTHQIGAVQRRHPSSGLALPGMEFDVAPVSPGDTRDRTARAADDEDSLNGLVARDPAAQRKVWREERARLVAIAKRIGENTFAIVVSSADASRSYTVVVARDDALLSQKAYLKASNTGAGTSRYAVSPRRSARHRSNHEDSAPPASRETSETMRGGLGGYVLEW